MVGPEIVLFATLHFGNEHWYYCFPMLGGITLFFGLWLAATPIQRETFSGESVSLGKSFALLKNKTLLVLFLGIFFMVGVDVATNYISSKLMTLRYEWTPDEVKFAPQVYFLSRTIGAFLGVFLLTKISALRYFRMNILACALVLLLLMFIDGHAILNLICIGGVGLFSASVFSIIYSLICIGGVGLFSASVFSIIYSLSFQEFPTKMNQISGLMITAVAGGGVVTPLLGMALDFAGVTAGLSVILLCVLYLIYCAFGVKNTSYDVIYCISAQTKFSR